MASLGAGGVLVRVRSQLGMWRFPNTDPSEPLLKLMERVAAEHNVPVEQQSMSRDPRGDNQLDPHAPLTAAGVCLDGDMLHLKIDKDAKALSGPEVPTGRMIAADGSIVSRTFEQAEGNLGFRPGMPRLRDIKGAWTLTDFLEMDDRFVFKIKKQEEQMCSGVTLDMASTNLFQQFMGEFGWRQARMGLLYGTFDDDQGVTVHAIYEPPQEGDEHGFTLTEDPRAEQVERLAGLLGLSRVGWIFAHPPREEGFLFSGEEILTAAMEQLEAAQGVDKTPFVTVRCSVDEEGQCAVDAFQVSLQCMEMVAEGALLADPDNRASCSVSPTFTAVMEGKEATSVDNTFFLLNVAVKQHESTLLATRFPQANRVGLVQTTDELKDLLSNSGERSLTDCLCDFHLLLFLMDFQDTFNWNDDMPRLCEAVTTKAPVDEGYQLIIRGFAGMQI